MIYNVVLVSGVQQSDLVVYICIISIYNIDILFFSFFSIIGFYEILNIVPCAIQ